MTGRELEALRKHPRHGTPLRLAVGLVIQVISWHLSALLDRGEFEAERIDVHSFDVEIADLPTSFDGYRLVHISDFHMGTWMNAARLRGVLGLVQDQSPDAVVITGDFASYTVKDHLQEMIGPLSALDAPDGVYAVLGNHDWWTDPEFVRACLAESGVRELRNAVVRLERGGEEICLAGVDDVYDGRADMDAVLADLPEAKTAILLAHEPDYADVAAATGRFALMLAGHSHGGQILLPGLGPPFLPHLAKKYPRGHYRFNGMQLYTNRGLGTSALQVRYRCPAEVAVLVLRAPAQQEHLHV